MTETTTNDPNIFRQVKCGICKKRVSTQLCDFVVQYKRPILFHSYEDFSEQQLHGTCDMPLCEDCAIKHNEMYDFCPHHAKMFKVIQPTQEMQRSIGEHIADVLKREFEGDK